MFRRRHAYFVLGVAMTALVAVLPASAHARHAHAMPCGGSPSFVGHAGDDGGFFRYPTGRGAEHINAGTFVLAIDDTSAVQNFHLSDLTCRPDPRPTATGKPVIDTVQHCEVSSSPVVERSRWLPPQVRSLRWKFWTADVFVDRQHERARVDALGARSGSESPPSSPAWPTKLGLHRTPRPRNAVRWRPQLRRPCGRRRRVLPLPDRARSRAHQRGHVRAGDRRHVGRPELPSQRPDLGRKPPRPLHDRRRGDFAVLDGAPSRSGTTSGSRTRTGDIRGVVTVHPAIPPPPPPPPPPPSPAGPPAPPPPPPPSTQPDLIFTVGPNAHIATFYADGRKLTNLPPGTYNVQVHDLSANHNLHLTGPGIDRRRRSRTSSTRLAAHLPRRHVPGEVRRPPDDQGELHGVHECAAGAALQSPEADRPRPDAGPPRDQGGALLGRAGPLARSRRARGKVVSQSPRAGRTLAVGTRVNLVVSRGRR